MKLLICLLLGLSTQAQISVHFGTGVMVSKVEIEKENLNHTDLAFNFGFSHNSNNLILGADISRPMKARTYATFGSFAGYQIGSFTPFVGVSYQHFNYENKGFSPRFGVVVQKDILYLKADAHLKTFALTFGINLPTE